jgi:hypothetical protein
MDGPAWGHARAYPPLAITVHQYISTTYGTYLNEAGMLASTGSVTDSYDNALAEAINGAYKTELIHRSTPFESVYALEQTTFPWVSWWNHERLHEHLGYQTPAEVETRYHQSPVTPITQYNTGNKNQSTSPMLRATSRVCATLCRETPCEREIARADKPCE